MSAWGWVGFSVGLWIIAAIGVFILCTASSRDPEPEPSPDPDVGFVLSITKLSAVMLKLNERLGRVERELARKNQLEIGKRIADNRKRLRNE